MTRRPARDELAAALFVAAMSAALLALAYVGLYAHYMADDYCTAASLHKLGFLAAQRRWYMERPASAAAATLIVLLLTPLVAARRTLALVPGAKAAAAA